MKRQNSEEVFVCPKCGMVSTQPNDVREGYCGYCHDWTGENKRRERPFT